MEHGPNQESTECSNGRCRRRRRRRWKRRLSWRLPKPRPATKTFYVLVALAAVCASSWRVVPTVLSLVPFWTTKIMRTLRKSSAFTRLHVDPNNMNQARTTKGEHPGNRFKGLGSLRRPRQRSGAATPDAAKDWIRNLDAIRSTEEMKTWISVTALGACWSIKDSIATIKYLQRRYAYDCILPFLAKLESRDIDDGDDDDDSVELVKVYTTALFAFSSWGRHGGRHEVDLFQKNQCALSVLDRMEHNNVEPTALTLVALFGCLHGSGPDSVVQLAQRLRDRHPDVVWNAEVYHTAIFACKRIRRHGPGRGKDQADSHNNNDDKDWQTALNLLQQMQRHQIPPMSKTYLALLEVLSPNGKVPVVKSLLRQWQNSRVVAQENSNIATTTANREENRIDEGNTRDRVWAAAINACAVAGDYRQALQFMQEMMTSTPPTTPNLRHCTALLKTFAVAGQDQLALTALSAMRGNTTATFPIPNGANLLLPPTAIDLIALNTVLRCLSKSNYHEAQKLLDRMANGEFEDANGGGAIVPDRISYHSLLTGCRDPVAAKSLVRSMRLSRRYRYKAVPPTNVTYAHAIQACQRAHKPDLESVIELLDWAKDDRIAPTVYMYAAAIWVAQRCDDSDRGTQLYDEMVQAGCQANALAMNGLISAVCGKSNRDKAMELFMTMKDKNFQASPETMKRFVSMLQSDAGLSASNRKGYLLRILDRLGPDELRVRVSGPVFEALISYYGTKGDVDAALKIASRIHGYIDAPCLRALLLAHATSTPVRWEEAIELLHASDVTGPEMVDQIALGNTLLAVSKADQFEEGITLLELYGVHVQKLSERSPPLPIVSLNALIASAGRGGRPDLSLAVLNKIYSLGIHPDSRSYRSAAISCNQAQHQKQIYGSDVEDGSFIEWWECALALLRRMKEEGLIPDKETFSSVISACEAAGQWQRAIGVMQEIIVASEESNSPEEPLSLNLYCWNAAISACEKGGAWVEALDLYERMLSDGNYISPNFVTLNSLLEALEAANQRDLAQSKYDEALNLGIVKPWKRTKNQFGETILALDLHLFSSAMATAAIRNIMDTWLDENDNAGGNLRGDFQIITGKGLQSQGEPVLRKTAIRVLQEYGIEATVDASNDGRLVVGYQELLDCFGGKSWR